MAVLTRFGLRRTAGALAGLGLAVLAAAVALTPARAAEPPSLEYAVKAAYLYKLGPFVQWPPQVFDGPRSTFNVCILGADPFGAALDDAVRGQTVDGRSVAVLRLETMTRASPCHVLYLSRARQPSAEVLELLRNAPVLTVTDEHSGTAGGLVHFVLRQGRVRFGVDARRAQASGLTISSKLLGLAVPVSGQAQRTGA